MESDIRSHLEEAIAANRKQALAQFFQELLPLLRKQGYDLSDLITALSDFASQRDDFEKAVECLDHAVLEIEKANEVFKNVHTMPHTPKPR